MMKMFYFVLESADRILVIYLQTVCFVALVVLFGLLLNSDLLNSDLCFMESACLHLLLLVLFVRLKFVSFRM